MKVFLSSTFHYRGAYSGSDYTDKAFGVIVLNEVGTAAAFLSIPHTHFILLRKFNHYFVTTFASNTKFIL